MVSFRDDCLTSIRLNHALMLLYPMKTYSGLFCDFDSDGYGYRHKEKL